MLHEEGPSPRGRIDAEGKFTLRTYDKGDGAPEGTYRVIVLQPFPPETLSAMRRSNDPHHNKPSGIPIVSLKHASPVTSGIKQQVEAVEENVFQIVVQPR